MTSGANRGFRGYSRSVEAPYCRSGREETGHRKNQNHIGYQIRTPISVFLRKRKTKCRKTENPQTVMKTKPEKTDVSWQKKKRKTDLINSQNRKIENPNAPPPLVLFLRKSIDKPSNVRLMLIRFLS